MKKYSKYVGFLFAVASHHVLAADLYIQAFYDTAPIKGITVMLDGTPIGETDARGAAQAPLSAGDHTVTLVNDDASFPIEFASGKDDDIELSVTFSTEEGVEPRVRVQAFGPDDAARSGYITGQITDSAGSPIAGVQVSAQGTDLIAQADNNGVYLLEVPRGVYTLEVSYPGYDVIRIDDIRVMADLGVTAAFTMLDDTAGGDSSFGQIEEVFVMGVFNPVEDSSSVERYATSIVSAIDIAQLERFGDSDVASALNRVAGVAVTDSKYATVRGLDGRYVSSTLNGLLMPSTDPQRRDVQLDLFPTAILGGIKIQKSYTPDLLATTTGGAIQIETKGIPLEHIHEVSGTLAYNTSFTGDDIIKYRGSNDDWLGFDSGRRDLPRDVVAATDGGSSLTVCNPIIDPVRCTSRLDAARLGVQFQDDYNISTKEALPDAKASWVYGDRLEAPGGEWGYYAAATYDRQTQDRGNAELSNPLETVGSYQRARKKRLHSPVSSSQATNTVTQMKLSVEPPCCAAQMTQPDSRTVSSSGKVIRSQVRFSNGLSASSSPSPFNGHNEFEFEHGAHQLDWRVAYSRTDRYEPDRRQYTYFNNNLSTSAFERRWSDLTEDSIDLGLDYTIPVDWNNTMSTEFKLGLLYSDKDREVEQYRFGIRLGDRRDISLGIDQDLEDDILPYENFALDRIRLSTNTTDTDSYDSEEDIEAYYLTTTTDFGERWSLLFGARYEDFSQLLEYPNEASASNSLEHDDWYPALNVTWRITDELQLRAGYSGTVSYPGLIERSESQSFDPETDDPIFGNPDLKVSTIDNLDLRLEYYFSDSESVSFAVFAKDIDQPIERAIPDASGSAARGTTFVNQDSAELLGLEIDANKILMDRDDFTLFVGGNLSYIDSEVELSEDSLRLEGEGADGRTLQGQSEWLANVQFGFDHYPSEQKVTLLINYFDDRIFRISRGESNGPEYEVGRTLVDLNYEKVFSDSFKLKAYAKNLLDEEVEYSQNDRVIESYQTGTLLGVSVSYQF